MTNARWRSRGSGIPNAKPHFLCLAALHGGYFLRRPVQRFPRMPSRWKCGPLDGERGCSKVTSAFTNQPIGRRFIMWEPSCFLRPLGRKTTAIDAGGRPYPVKVKLMGLDFVLAHQQHHYLATEAEKLDYFVSRLGLNSHPSQRIYRSRHGPQYHHTLFRRQVSAVSLWRVERALGLWSGFVMWTAP